MQRPRFRTDLVSQPVEENGQRFVDVTDPDSGKTFRFYEVEYAVACAMNGARSVRDLADWARAELGLEPSSGELETVISTLGDLGYLASNGANLDVDDLALGAPGRSPLDSGAPPRPKAEEFELGVAGKSPMGGTPKPQSAAPTPVELGAAGFSTPEPQPPFELDSRPPAPMPAAAPQQAPQPMGEVSTNLGEHLSIGADDVKEAVRQSKIMEAVPMPADVMQEMEAPSEPSTPPPGATPIELPGRQRPEPPPKQVAPPPPRPGGSNLTIVLLIVLLVVAVGLAAYYFFVYAKSDDTEGTRRQPGTSDNTTAPAEAGEPAAIVARLAAGEVTETAVAAPESGKLEWVEAAGSEVSEGAIIAKYNGFKKAATELEAAVKSRDRYKAKLEKATERNDRRDMAKHAADVERKEGDIAEHQDAAQKLAVKAPAAGVVTPLVEAGSSVNEGDEIVKLAVTTGPSATFELAGAETREVGDTIEVAAKNDPSLTAACKISKVTGNRVSVTCPTDIGIEEGAEIIVRLVP